MTAAIDTNLVHSAVRAAEPVLPVAGDVVERTVTTGDGVRLAVRDYPADSADAPTVVLLHGLCLSQDSWEPQVCLLRSRWGRRIRIISYDHRGHGRSAEAPMPTYRIEQLAADLAEVLTTLRVTGPLTLAGHSMGGMTALAYLSRPAALRPVQPQGLVLVGTAAGRLAERGLGRLLATRATGTVFGLVHRMPQRATDNAVKALLRPVGAAVSRLRGNSTAIAVVGTAVRSTSLTTAAGFLPSLKSYSTYDALASITAKTIIVSGGADVLTPVSHSRDLAAGIAGAIHLHHPTASHMLLQEAADCVGNAISRATGMLRRPGRAAGTGLSRSCAAHLAVVVS